MGIAERKEREKQEMKDQILQAAMELFVEEGYEKASIRKIADRIEYSPAAPGLYSMRSPGLVRVPSGKIRICRPSAARAFAWASMLRHAGMPDGVAAEWHQENLRRHAFQLTNAVGGLPTLATGR